MATPTGRIARIVAGIALVLVGLLGVQGGLGVVIALVGVLPIAAGAFNFCAIAPLIGAPFLGKDA